MAFCASRYDRAYTGVDPRAALFGMFARFQNQKGSAGSSHDATALTVLPLPDRLPLAAMQIPSELVGEQHVGVLGLERASNQHMGGLAGAYARGCRFDGRHTGAFLTHESARRSGHLVNNGDVSGQQI